MRTLLLCLAVVPALSAELVLVNVDIQTDPPGARIEIGSTMAGRTPATLKLPPGEHQIHLSLAHFQEWTQKVAVKSDGANSIKVELQPAAAKPAAAGISAHAEAPARPVATTDGSAPTQRAPDTTPDAAADPAAAEQNGRKSAAMAALARAMGGHSVRYVVNGEGEASLTLIKQSGETEQMKVALPWEYTFWSQQGGFFQISARKVSQSGWIEAEIFFDGELIQRARSNADYGIASAGGKIPLTIQ